MGGSLTDDEELVTAIERELPMVEHELEGHLATLFDVGILRLERITWGSSARLLEKLIEYEAVHEIRGWDDLRDRLDAANTAAYAAGEGRGDERRHRRPRPALT